MRRSLFWKFQDWYREKSIVEVTEIMSPCFRNSSPHRPECNSAGWRDLWLKAVSVAKGENKINPRLDQPWLYLNSIWVFVGRFFYCIFAVADFVGQECMYWLFVTSPTLLFFSVNFPNFICNLYRTAWKYLLQVTFISTCAQRESTLLEAYALRV